jgi:uncharacterized protein (DUF58 family)
VAPTPRAAVLLAIAAAGVLFLPGAVVVVAIIALATAAVVDGFLVRTAPALDRSLPTVLSRGVPSPFRIEAISGGRQVRVRQPAVPDVTFEPQEGPGELSGMTIPLRRGRHEIPGVASLSEGPLGLARWFHRSGEPQEVLVYPDLPAARRIALAVREGRFGEPGRMTRGPLGLGTQFESIRDYLPDDDIRQVNWRATSRMGRPMSNQYRVEQDRDVVCVVDTGRLMGAPLSPSRTRLDAALDATVALALTADVVGDRCGAVAFDSGIRRNLQPHRIGGQALVRAVFDLEPTEVDSNYELAFRTVGGGKRSFVIVFTDLIDESAATSLLEGVPMLARKHAVAVASVADTDLVALAEGEATEDEVHARKVARRVLDARKSVIKRLQRAGVAVIEAPPESFSAACVAAYLRAKAKGRL